MPRNGFVKIAEVPEVEATSLDDHTVRVVRLYLERVARKLERVQASPSYKSAFKNAARLIREAKPE